MFDRSTVKNTRDKLEAALVALSEELGCQIKVGSASFAPDGSNCTFKVEFAEVNPDGTAETREVTAFRQLAAAYGLSPDDLGKTFVNGGQEFTISGLSTKAKRYPILATRADGRAFKFPADMVKLVLSNDRRRNYGNGILGGYLGGCHRGSAGYPAGFRRHPQEAAIG